MPLQVYQNLSNLLLFHQVFQAVLESGKVFILFYYWFLLFQLKKIFMRWIGGRESSNVDDRRGISGGGIAIGGGIIGVIVVVLRLLLGGGGGGDEGQIPIQFPGQP